MVHCQHGDPVNTKCLFFLDVGRMPAASRESIQFNIASHCSAIKYYFAKNIIYVIIFIILFLEFAQFFSYSVPHYLYKWSIFMQPK